MPLLYLPVIFGVSIEVFFIVLFLGVPTFFIWRWLLKKVIKTNKARKIATWAATLVTAPLIYVGLFMLWVFCTSYYPSRDFEQGKWFADKEKRYELSESIIESNMLIGKTKAEVRQLLGDEGNADGREYWSYYLGFKPGLFNIDPDVLDIEFKDGRVVRVDQHGT